MSAFDLTKDVERVGLEALMPFLRLKAFDGRFVVANKGALAPMLQTCAGDLLVQLDPDALCGVEMKTEAEDKTGNLFLETWSNRGFRPRKPGWMLTQECDFLWYYFLDSDRLYVLNFRALWEWSFVTPSRNTRGGAGRLFDFPERLQGKYGQRNMTAGRCVPLATLGREVGYSLFMPNSRGPAWRERVRPLVASNVAAA